MATVRLEFECVSYDGLGSLLTPGDCRYARHVRDVVQLDALDLGAEFIGDH